MNKPVITDYLVIGGGVAGLRAAIGLARSANVLLINKGANEESTSRKAQGGIAAVLNEEEGEIASHYQDTLDAGHGLCRPEAVRILVEEGRERVEELIAWGAKFDKIGSQFAPVLEGAHRRPRILRADGDATGVEIVKTLIQQVKKIPNIHHLSNHFAIHLIVESGQCKGVLVFDEIKGVIYPIFAQGVILATGGAGQLFERTTNPSVSTGDGMAMALLAGAVMEDMEFVQFHPTSLSLPDAPPFLLSEAMRGEGARLVNTDGKPFMDAYHTDKELAPRDIVTRAILNEMRQGQSVFLDLTILDADFIKKRFPTIYTTCKTYGVDITCNPIPVAPAAHYMMGGIKTDLLGRTSIDRLWAVGEVAVTGVHGANRLASNALLEGLVFGARAPQAGGGNLPLPLGAVEGQIFSPTTTEACSPLPPVEMLQKTLKQTMWNDVGIIRSAASLDRAAKKLQEMQWIVSTPIETIPFPSLREVLETRNMVIVATTLITAAKQRKESIGAHFREDSPKGLCRPPYHIALTWDRVR
jgi:L-aspartate oxidase